MILRVFSNLNDPMILHLGQTSVKICASHRSAGAVVSLQYRRQAQGQSWPRTPRRQVWLMLATCPAPSLLPDLFCPALTAASALCTLKFLKGLPLALPRYLLEVTVLIHILNPWILYVLGTAIPVCDTFLPAWAALRDGHQSPSLLG